MISGLKIGMTATAEKLVSETDTAMFFGSGSIDVLASPVMFGLMEKAALKAVDASLDECYTTVGTHLNASHLAASAVGCCIYAEANLVKISGKELTFNVEAFDDFQKIGEGTHTRYIVTTDKFLKNVYKKIKKE